MSTESAATAESLRAELREQHVRFKDMGKAGIARWIEILLLDPKDERGGFDEVLHTHLNMLKGLPGNLPADLTIDDMDQLFLAEIPFAIRNNLLNWAKDPSKSA